MRKFLTDMFKEEESDVIVFGVPLGKFSNEELKRIYSNLKNTVNVDIIDDGEKLNKIEDNSQDFIIANHFIEHCQKIVEYLKKEQYNL